MRYKSVISLSVVVLMSIAVSTPVLAGIASHQSDDSQPKVEQKDTVRPPHSAEASFEKKETDHSVSVPWIKYLTMYVFGGALAFACATGLSAYTYYTQWQLAKKPVQSEHELRGHYSHHDRKSYSPQENNDKR